MPVYGGKSPVKTAGQFQRADIFLPFWTRPPSGERGHMRPEGIVEGQYSIKVLPTLSSSIS